MAIRIYTTVEWGALPVSKTFSKLPAKGIVIHNTGGGAGDNRPPKAGDAEKQLAFAKARAIQADHMDSPKKRWADSGQHFLVSRGGIIMESRHGTLNAANKGLVVQGAHAGSAVFNNSWFGIENEGNYTLTNVVPTQEWEALIELCAWLAWKGKFDTQNIIGHQDIKRKPNGDVATDCPGILEERLQALRQAAHDKKLELMG